MDKFARCQECGNTETFNTEVPFCDGAGDSLRRHPRTRMVEVSKEQVLEQFGATEGATEDQRKQAATDAEKALGLEEGSLSGGSTQGNEVFRPDEGRPYDPTNDPTNAAPQV